MGAQPSLKDAALQYARNGWPVFPCQPGEKAPAGGRGVLDATTDLRQVEECWTRWPDANIGFHAGAAGFMVLDYDNGSDPNAVADHYGLPEAGMMVRTPSNGEHEYLTLPAGTEVPPSASKVAPKVDIRSHNSYVLLPPSRTAAGAYEWIERGSPAPAPKALIEAACAGKRERAADAAEWLIEPDLPNNIEACAAWLRDTARPAIEGQGGDATTVAAAAMCRSHGLSEDMALQLLAEVYNPRCEPPWEPEDLAVKVENAYRYATSAPGNMTAEYRAAKLGFGPATSQAEAPADDELPLWSGPDLAHFPPVEWIISGYLRDGTSLFYGLPKSGKTSLLAAAAVAVAHGAEAWGQQTCGGCRVLFLATEDPDGAKRAIVAACIALGVPVEECRVDVVNINACGIPQISSETDMAKVRRTMMARGHKILIVDVMAFATGGQDMSETEKLAAALAHIKPLYERDGISTWLSTHATKDGSSYFGGVLLLGSVFQAWRVYREGDHICAANTAMRGAPQVSDVLQFAPQQIPLPGAADDHGRQPDAMFPKFVGSARRDSEVLTKAGQVMQVRYLLAALRSKAGKKWAIRDLGIEARRRGCKLALKTLQNHVLGAKGWARAHPALSAYWDEPSESWCTPPKLPDLPREFEIRTEENVVEMPQSRQKSAA